MIYEIVGFLLLGALYLVYIGKMLSQKRKGIKTDQIARGEKKGRLFYVECIMKIATYSIVVIEIISIILIQNNIPDGIRLMGAIIAFLGVMIFAISVWTMRDSWRAGIAIKDKTKIVTTGIYAWSRNPAFFGFDLLYIGILLMFFNWILLIFTVFAMLMLHLQILQEEHFLPSLFGEAYISYKQHTGRYFGRKRV